MLVVQSVAPVVHFVSIWVNAVSTPFGIFCCFPFTSICDSISSRFMFMVGCGHLSMWSIVSLVDVHPGHWLMPVTWCLMWPSGSHLCIILQVCIRLIPERFHRTELIDAQLTVLIVSVDHEYLFIMYVVSDGVRCTSYCFFVMSFQFGALRKSHHTEG